MIVVPPALISWIMVKICATSMQQFGAGHQGTPHREHLLLPAGEGFGQLLLPLEQAWETGKDLINFLKDSAFVVADVGAHLEIFENGHIGKDPPSFRNLGDSAFDDFVRRNGGDRLAKKCYRA